MAAEIAKALVHQIGDRRFAGPSLDRPLVCEAYRDNRELDSFILIDSLSRCTAAAGMIDFSLRRAHQYPLADAGRGQNPDPIEAATALRALVHRLERRIGTADLVGGSVVAA
jgi:sulfate adenylyltransferase subunit 1 (EFTu-like GTPase family)